MCLISWICSKICWLITIICIIVIIALGLGLGLGLRKKAKEESNTSNKFTGSLLLRNSGSIQTFDLSDNRFSTVLKDDIYGISSFEYYPNRTIYYATTKPNEPILSSSEKYPKLSQYTGQWTRTALAVDFIGEKLYVVDGLEQKVYVTDVEGKYYSVVLKDLKDPKDIAVDPYEGLMFVLQASSILQATMDGKTVSTILTGIDLKALAIDRSKTTLYYVTANSIESYDYKKGTRVTVMPRASEMTSLSVFEDRLYVVEVVRSTKVFKVLSSCKLVDGICREMDVVYTSDNMQAVKVFESNVGAMQNPCGSKNGDCEHLCLLTSGRGHSCVCTEGWKLNSDQKTCSKSGSLSAIFSDLTRKIVIPA